MSNEVKEVDVVPTSITLTALQGFPLIQEGDDIAEIILQTIFANNLQIENNDIFVIAQKIISKSEGRKVCLEDVSPSEKAINLANKTNKDPRIVELILNESSEIIRVAHGVIITKHKLGFIMANAGIDQSNINENDDESYALLLPVDPDASSKRIKDAIEEITNKKISVIVNDSIGRPWRIGTVGHALGVAGLSPVIDLRGTKDLFQRELKVSEVALADELSAAASILMGQGSEGKPIILIRGLQIEESQEGIKSLLRPKTKDLFL